MRRQRSRAGRPLFVLTDSVPDSGARTFLPYTFVTDGIESAVTQAEAVAGDKRVFAGSQATQQCLSGRTVDEIQAAVAPCC
jgi:dihydrofolate reductase